MISDWHYSVKQWLSLSTTFLKGANSLKNIQNKYQAKWTTWWQAYLLKFGYFFSSVCRDVCNFDGGDCCLPKVNTSNCYFCKCLTKTTRIGKDCEYFIDIVQFWNSDFVSLIIKHHKSLATVWGLFSSNFSILCS